ncbi:Palmitoylated plasma membrane-bound casein kinase [Aspergillus tubingensis]
MSVEFTGILHESPGHVGFSTFFRYFLFSTYLGGLKGSMRLYCVIARELSPSRCTCFDLPTQLLLQLLMQVNMMLTLGSVDILFFFLICVIHGSRIKSIWLQPACSRSLSLSLSNLPRQHQHEMRRPSI